MGLTFGEPIKDFAGIPIKFYEIGVMPCKYIKKCKWYHDILCFFGIHNYKSKEKGHEWVLYCDRCGKIHGTGHSFSMSFVIKVDNNKDK